jgi:hypothetical protein
MKDAPWAGAMDGSSVVSMVERSAAVKDKHSAVELAGYLAT